ncbi:hypothetical protein EYC95_07880 [Pseudomonas sp. BGI-2]|nr:hypothetical protein EYC95_07880 [Pseudomonas sp. BGI-2]
MKNSWMGKAMFTASHESLAAWGIVGVWSGAFAGKPRSYRNLLDFVGARLAREGSASVLKLTPELQESCKWSTRSHTTAHPHHKSAPRPAR